MIGDDVRAQALVVEANPKDQVWQGLSLRLNDYSLHKPGPEGFCLFEHGHNTYEQVFGQALSGIILWRAPNDEPGHVQGRLIRGYASPNRLQTTRYR